MTHVCTLYLVDLGIDLGALGALGVQTVASFARSMCADQIKKSARATSWCPECAQRAGRRGKYLDTETVKHKL
jgi:hypothetical protein